MNNVLTRGISKERGAALRFQPEVESIADTIARARKEVQQGKGNIDNVIEIPSFGSITDKPAASRYTERTTNKTEKEKVIDINSKVNIEESPDMITMIQYLNAIDSKATEKILESISYIKQYLDSTTIDDIVLEPVKNFFMSLDFKQPDSINKNTEKISKYLAGSEFNEILKTVFKNEDGIKFVKQTISSIVDMVVEAINKIAAAFSMTENEVIETIKDAIIVEEADSSEPIIVEVKEQDIKDVKEEIKEVKIDKEKVDTKEQIQPEIKVPHSPVEQIKTFTTVGADGEVIATDHHAGINYEVFSSRYHHADGNTDLEDQRDRILKSKEDSLQINTRNYIDELVQTDLKGIVKAITDLNLNFDIYRDSATIDFVTFSPEIKGATMNFSVDLDGALYNKIPKIIIPCSDTCIAEDSIFIKLASTGLLTKYLSKAMSISELKKHNIITPADISLNKFIELATIPEDINMSKLRPNLVKIQNSPELKDAAFGDMRFRIDVIQSENKFTLVSDTSVKQHLNADYIEKPTVKVTYNSAVSRNSIKVENVI